MSAESLLLAVVLACATCSHNDPLYTDKVSKFARRRTCKGFSGRELERFDSVNLVSMLIDTSLEYAATARPEACGGRSEERRSVARGGGRGDGKVSL